MMSFEQLREWQGRDLCDINGEKIGSIDDFYVDTDTQRPEWIIVNTGFLGLRNSFVPAMQAEQRDGCLLVPYEKDMVKDAPNADADGELSDEEEVKLYDHYGLERSEATSDTGYAAGSEGQRDVREERRGDLHARQAQPSDRPAMTRSEESLGVSKVRRPSETVRLKKYVVTEPVQKTIPVQREEVRLEREPIDRENIDEAMEGPEIAEREHDVTLNREEVRIEKDVKPVERVRLEKDVTTEEQRISDEVRKEKIDVDRKEDKAA
jgi:uncharacterized protein (TIGR02271 family)